MSKSILEDLNPEQADAVSSVDRPLLVLAGAGSGKTRVITCKFANLSKKLAPNSILAVTFTNKAAKEMKERIFELTKKSLSKTWIGTFHSQCTKVLRREIKALGYKNDFSILDESDQCHIIRHILKEFKTYEALCRGVHSRISNLKASFITPEEFLSSGDGFGFEERLARVYLRYQDELKRSNALDFDDLIMLTVKLFEQYPDILERYRERFEYILVDEFQDTNNVQYRLLKLLASGRDNICVVGDDDQSIYGFRGANINNILSFERDFPKVKVIKLERNYRSTQKILDVSESVIRENKKRLSKTLWSERKDGDKVSHCWFGTEDEETRHITKLIKELYLKGIYEYKEFAVLYRINLQSKTIEDALRREKIPYRVLGGISFYQRKEIKDMTAYLKLILNRDDNAGLRRIINCPARGIGASTLSKIEQHAKKHSMSLYASIKSIIDSNGLTGSSKSKLEGFINIIDEMSSDKYKDASEMLRNIFIKTGYSNFVEAERVENIDEMISSAEGKDALEFSDSVSLSSSHDESTDETAVSLLTLHGAKGLEFPVVFITGLEEGVLPYFKAKSHAEIEEERRLFYVGLTRAKDILCLSGARKRRLYSKVQESEPSRFLKSIPDKFCTKIEKIGEVIQPSFPLTGKKLKTFKPSSDYSIGSRVKHPKWGVGVVRDCYGDEDDQKITVNFPSIGIKRLALKFANIERIR